MSILQDIYEKAGEAADAVCALSKNVGYARQTVNYLLKTVGMEAANWDKWRGEPSWERGTKSKDRLDRCVWDTVRPAATAELGDVDAATKEQVVRAIGRHATANGCGNCGEFAAAALLYLESLGVRPLDLMKFPDHAFVVIGRDASTDAADWTSWNFATAVCDPWGQGFRRDSAYGSYAGYLFESRMGSILSIESDPLELVVRL